ncbi:MAG: single-stranded-DNA-specific exonuclease RecJ [Fastidiosipilaceae bacterium]|jgi:single-stranded-DNA-specific exonuclease
MNTQYKPKNDAAPISKYDQRSLLQMVLYARNLPSVDALGTDTVSEPINGVYEAEHRIRKAIQRNESILIYGDYDCDGMVATAILAGCLRQFKAKVAAYIPSREANGYGLTDAVVEQFSKRPYDLLITVDNGIAAIDQIRRIRELGSDVIVLDHHLPVTDENGEVVLPDAYIVDPHLPYEPSYKGICGAGVVHQVIKQLNQPYADYVEELVAVATLADVMPVTGENRNWLNRMIKQMETNPKHPFIKVALDYLKPPSPLTAEYIVFHLSPMINSVGRIGNPNQMVRVFLEPDTETLYQYIESLDQINQKRKDISADLEATWMDQLQQTKSKQGAVLFISQYSGLTGIVAGKASEKGQKPAICFAWNETNHVWNGSGRSFGEINLYEILSAMPTETMLRWGGHEGACGITLAPDQKNIFELEFYKQCNRFYKKDPHLWTHSIYYDVEVPLTKYTLDEVKRLSKMEPFGEGNTKPLFFARGVARNVRAIGSDKQHVKGTLNDGHGEVSFIAFNHKCREGTQIEGVFKETVNAYNNTETVQLQAVSMQTI